MKRVTILFAAFCILISSTACAKGNAAGKHRISYPQFYQQASDSIFYSKDISFAIPEEQKAALIKTIKLYRAEPLSVTKSYEEKILNAFAFQDYSRKVNDEKDIIYISGSKEITIYPNGIFTFEIPSVDQGERPFNATQEEVRQMATNFLTSHDLLPNDFILTDKKGEGKVTSLDENGNEQTIITSRGAYFIRKIDGIEVYGTSKILIEFNADGVCSVCSLYSKTGKAETVELINLDEACKRAKTEDAFKKTWETDKLKGEEIEAVVDKVKIVYYDDPLDENTTHIQPCYLFEGTATDEMGNKAFFEITVPALAESYYKVN